MLFESLHHSAEQGELILVDGGYCRYHLRNDGQITIYEILVLPDRQRQGIGTAMLDQLRALNPASLYASCPTDLPANTWYQHRGFTLEHTDTTRTGRELNRWRLALS